MVPYLIPLRQPLEVVWNPLNPSSPAVSTPKSSGVTTCNHTQLLTWVLEILTQGFDISTLAHRAISPAHVPPPPLIDTSLCLHSGVSQMKPISYKTLRTILAFLGSEILTYVPFMFPSPRQTDHFLQYILFPHQEKSLN